MIICWLNISLEHDPRSSSSSAIRIRSFWCVFDPSAALILNAPMLIGNWCDSLHVTAFHLRFSPQVLGYHLECSQISKFPLPAAKLFWSSPVPFWVPDMSCVGTSHDNFGAPHKWIGVTCPKHCYLRGFRHLTPFHSKTWIALVASCGDPWSQFLWVALFRIRDLGRPWEPQNISLNIATKIQIHVMAMIDFQGISLQKPRPTEAENG